MCLGVDRLEGLRCSAVWFVDVCLAVWLAGGFAASGLASFLGNVLVVKSVAMGSTNQWFGLFLFFDWDV